MDILARKIKEIREHKKMSKSELARLIGVSPAYITMLENGTKKNPSIDTLKKISNALNIPLSEFLKEDKKTTILNKKTGDIVTLNTPSVKLEESGSKIKLMNITTEIVTELEDSIHEYLAVISPVEKNGFDSDKVNELVDKVTELIRFEIYKEKKNKEK